MTTEHAYLRLIGDGLPATRGPRRRVVVVGAGMAGLVAAYELLRAGHDPVVLEAQQRVGGRVLTLREPFAPGLYAEVGAMRIPRAHALTLAYVDKFGLPIRRFTMDNPDGVVPPVRTQAPLARDRRRSPALVAAEMPEQERGRPATSAGSARSGRSPTAIAAQGDDALGRDRRPLRRPLDARVPGGAAAGPKPAIELFGLLQNQEALMNSSLPRAAARGGGPLLRRPGADRRRHGPAAARVPAGAREPHPLRRAHVRDRPGPTTA